MSTVCLFYDAGGRILRSGTLSDETFAHHVDAGGTFLIDVLGDPATQYIRLSDLAVVDYTEAEKAALAALAPGWHWQMPERVAVDMRALDAAKAQARARVNAARELAEHAPFTCNGLQYDADVKATARITGAVSLAMMAMMTSQPFTKDWTLFDNSEVTLDGPAMMAVGAALGTQVGAVFDTARALQAQIEAATTTAQADAITWPEA